MKYRQVELFGLKTISADQTEILDIDLVDPISQILIDLRVANGAIAASTGHPAESVTLIEMVDGSDVLYSLTALCAQALDIYSSGIYPRGGWFNYLPSTETELRIALDFGRYLYDPILALDPKQFKNLQLKITHDVSAGGTNPSSCKLNITANVFDEKVITPTGFLMSKEIKSWSGDAAAHEYTDLPTDYPYRALFIQGLKRGAPPNWVLDTLKLSEDQDKRIVFNDHFRDLMYGMGRKNAFIREAVTCGNNGTALNRHITPTMDVHGNATAWAAAAAADDYSVYDGDGGQLAVRSSGATSCNAVVGGWAPHAVLMIPFGDQQDMEDWYAVAGIGSLKMDVLDGQDTTTSKIFIQQHRPY